MRRLTHPAITIPTALLLAWGGFAGRAAGQAAAARPQLTAPSAIDARQGILADADHLVQLARELKASVEKARRDELSLQVIREADEIEKLARSVKARIH